MKNSTFVLDLSIGDQEYFEFFNEELTITVESGAIKPQPGIWYEGPKVLIEQKSLPILTKSGNFTLKGQIVDDVVVKDYYIFLDEEKIYYESNPHETNTMKINASVELKDGNNTLTILARDNNKLTTRETFVIQKGDFK